MKSTFRLLTAPLTIMALVTLGMPATSSAEPTGGTETFLGIQTGLSSPARVVALGPIAAIGTDHVVSDTRDVYHFPAGSLTVDHHPTSEGKPRLLNRTTCVRRSKETGTFKIVRASGAYAGATGGGTYTVNIYTQGCGRKPSVFVFSLGAHGRVSLPG